MKPRNNCDVLSPGGPRCPAAPTPRRQAIDSGRTDPSDPFGKGTWHPLRAIRREREYNPLLADRSTTIGFVAYENRILEVTDEGEVVRHVTITTCRYDGCEATVELEPVPVE